MIGSSSSISHKEICSPPQEPQSSAVSVSLASTLRPTSRNHNLTLSATHQQQQPASSMAVHHHHHHRTLLSDLPDGCLLQIFKHLSPLPDKFNVGACCWVSLQKGAMAATTERNAEVMLWVYCTLPKVHGRQLLHLPTVLQLPMHYWQRVRMHSMLWCACAVSDPPCTPCGTSSATPCCKVH